MIQSERDIRHAIPETRAEAVILAYFFKYMLPKFAFPKDERTKNQAMFKAVHKELTEEIRRFIPDSPPILVNHWNLVSEFFRLWLSDDARAIRNSSEISRKIQNRRNSAFLKLTEESLEDLPSDPTAFSQYMRGLLERPGWNQLYYPRPEQVHASSSKSFSDPAPTATVTPAPPIPPPVPFPSTNSVPPFNDGRDKEFNGDSACDADAMWFNEFVNYPEDGATPPEQQTKAHHLANNSESGTRSLVRPVPAKSPAVPAPQSYQGSTLLSAAPSKLGKRTRDQMSSDVGTSSLSVPQHNVENRTLLPMRKRAKVNHLEHGYVPQQPAAVDQQQQQTYYFNSPSYQPGVAPQAVVPTIQHPQPQFAASSFSVILDQAQIPNDWSQTLSAPTMEQAVPPLIGYGGSYEMYQVTAQANSKEMKEFLEAAVNTATNLWLSNSELCYRYPPWKKMEALMAMPLQTRREEWVKWIKTDDGYYNPAYAGPSA